MIPPPNVTGSLHMGHAFQQTIMDTMIRYQRMQGKNTLWQAGTDHAGIATQMVVERKIAAEEGKTRHDYGRDAFIDKIWQWKAESGGTITRQMRRLGNSVDWERERFTMDEGLSNAVKEVFVRLYKEDLIYRGKRLVNWDPKLRTAISDLEVENRESKGSMWHMRYPLADGAKTADGKDYLVVATTRPETLLGDTGVAVNPEDPALQRSDRQSGDAAAGQPPHSDRRRRTRRHGKRHRLREDHPGARLQRLRSGPSPRPADDQHPDLRRRHPRERGSVRHQRQRSQPDACSRRHPGRVPEAGALCRA